MRQANADERRGRGQKGGWVVTEVGEEVGDIGPEVAVGRLGVQRKEMRTTRVGVEVGWKGRGGVGRRQKGKEGNTEGMILGNTQQPSLEARMLANTHTSTTLALGRALSEGKVKP